MHDDRTMAQQLMEVLAPLMQEDHVRAAVHVLKRLGHRVHTGPVGESTLDSGMLGMSNMEVYALPDGSMIARTTNISVLPADVRTAITGKLKEDMHHVNDAVTQALKETKEESKSDDEPTVLAGDDAMEVLRAIVERARKRGTDNV